MMVLPNTDPSQPGQCARLFLVGRPASGGDGHCVRIVCYSGQVNNAVAAPSLNVC